MIRVELPYHLRNLAGVTGEVALALDGAPTIASALDALEQAYPMLRGTIRDHGTLRRRPFIRFFAAGTDLSLAETSTALPESVARGTEPLLIIGSIAGG